MTGKDTRLEELEQEITAQIEEVQKEVSDVQKMILKISCNNQFH